MGKLPATAVQVDPLSVDRKIPPLSPAASMMLGVVG
jgi:hypothetical protein